MPTITVNIPHTTFISSAQPNSNMSFYPVMYIGTDATYQNSKGLLQIDLSSIPVTAVDSAYLKFAVISKTGAAASPVAVQRVTEPFDTSTVTYNTAPAYAATASQINVSSSDLYTIIQINVTALINSLLAGTYPNYGIALTNSDGTTAVQFATNNIVYEPYFPTLTVEYTITPEETTAICFSYHQLANIITQIIALYPANTITVYTKGFTASSVTGTPYQLYTSSVGTYGGIFILLENGKQQAIPLNSIAAIYTGDGTTYNQSISYLTAPVFPSGCDTNIITAIHDYLPVSTEVQMYAGSNISASGLIYKNEYGILVLSDADGNTPVFVPVMNITAFVPTFTDSAKSDGLPQKATISIKSVDGYPSK